MSNSDPSANTYSQAERIDEEKRVRHLRTLVDLTLAVIAQTPLSHQEAQDLVEAVRRRAHRLFPDKDATFELIYAPRFRRLIMEKFALH